MYKSLCKVQDFLVFCKTIPLLKLVLLNLSDTFLSIVCLGVFRVTFLYNGRDMYFIP